MMRGTWKIISSNARSKALAFEESLPVPLLVQPMKSARVMRLRFDAGRNVLKLTCPAWMSRRKALAWAADQQDWVDDQLARALPANPFVPDALLPLEGRDVRIHWTAAEPRSPRLDGQVLRCGGPLEGLARRVETFLKRRAVDRLSLETAEFAAAAGVRPRSVSVGDADSRWGSCSASGRIRYSWRLILAPPEARRFVVAHEVAHLVHLNHGKEFKALEKRLFGPGLTEAKALLRRVGPRLKRVGRGG
jgi:predicted metal-dependent hydrolase